MRGVYIAPVDDFQRIDKFLPEIVFPAPRTGEDGERLHDRMLAEAFAEVGFHAPDGCDDGRIDAESALRDRKPVTPAPHRCAAIRNALIIDEASDIIPNRRCEFRLRMFGFDNIRIVAEIAGRAFDG